jgi:hypothetical protein
MECRPNIELAYSKKADGSNSVYAWFSRHPADIVLLQLNASELPLGLTGVLQVLDEIIRWEMGFSVQPVAVVIAGIIGREPEVMAFNRGLQAFVAQKTSAVGTDARDELYSSILIKCLCTRLTSTTLGALIQWTTTVWPRFGDKRSFKTTRWRNAHKVRRPRNSWFVSRAGQRRRASCLIAAPDLYCYCG